MSVGLRLQPDRGRRKMSVVAQEDEIDEVFGCEKGQELWLEHDDADDDQAERSADEEIVEGRLDECSTNECGGEWLLLLLLRHVWISRPVSLVGLRGTASRGATLNNPWSANARDAS